MGEETENSSTVSEELLKQISGEFCLDSIFILDISCRGVSSLGSIPQCLNLCILDLSSNHISFVGELAVLIALEQLDLSDNCISQLEGLQKLEKLSRLELAGNRISSFDSLLPLSSLCNLEHLTLQQSSSDHPTVHLSNPICKDTTYAAAMSDIFPTLHWLDREVVKDGAPGKTFYDRCRAIEENCAQKSNDYQVRDVCDSKDPLEIVIEADQESEEKIQSLLAECTDTSSKVKKLLNDVKKELKLPA